MLSKMFNVNPWATCMQLIFVFKEETISSLLVKKRKVIFGRKESIVLQLYLYFIHLYQTFFYLEHENQII